MLEYENYFGEMVGQEKPKRQLGFYIDGYRATSILPHLLIVGAKGQGKTQFSIETARNLHCQELNAPKPMISLNASSIKNMLHFIEQVYLKHIHDQHCTVFIDEIHALPEDVQTAFLTILNPNKYNRTTYRLKDYVCDFNFKQVSFIFATTDPQKLNGPFKDRCKMIHLTEYSYSDLAEILRRHIDEAFTVVDKIANTVATICRGNARNAVEIAGDINKFLAAQKRKALDATSWDDLKELLGILPLGLEDSELQLLRILDNGAKTLTNLAARSGFSPEAIRGEYELFLLKNDLIEIQTGGRRLTKKGRDYLAIIDKHGL